MTYTKTLQNKVFTEAVVTKCLTEKCADCTGSYVNKIFEHRLICKCPCGHTESSRHLLTSSGSAQKAASPHNEVLTDVSNAKGEDRDVN